MISKLFATVIAANICGDVACLRIRVCGALEKGRINKWYPATFPHNTLNMVAEVIVRIKDKPGLRPEDVAIAMPRQDITLNLKGLEIAGIQKGFPDTQQSATIADVVKMIEHGK